MARFTAVALVIGTIELTALLADGRAMNNQAQPRFDDLRALAADRRQRSRAREAAMTM